MKAPVDKSNMNKYCDFHQDHGHKTENCVMLHLEMQKLIKDGMLTRFVVDQRQQQKSPCGNDNWRNNDHQK